MLGLYLTSICADTGEWISAHSEDEHWPKRPLQDIAWYFCREIGRTDILLDWNRLRPVWRLTSTPDWSAICLAPGTRSGHKADHPIDLLLKLVDHEAGRLELTCQRRKCIYSPVNPHSRIGLSPQSQKAFRSCRTRFARHLGIGQVRTWIELCIY